jgi:PAS domain S-box-containing protein
LVFKNSKNDDNDLRKQFEEDPFKTNELNESIIQNAHVLLIVLDKKGNILIWNRAAEVISGYSKEEVLHNNLIWKQLYPDKEYRDQVNKKIFDIIDKNDFFENLETIIQTKSGQSRVIEWNTQKMKSKTNGYITFIAIGRDITERKNAVEALYQSEEKFRTFADYTYDWEYWVLPDNTILYTSPSCERITGYTPDEFYKNPELMDEIIIPEDQDARARHMNQIFVSTDPKSVDYRIRHRNGEVRWIAHICQPVYNKKKELVGRRSSNRDITERKQIEEALKESEEMFRNPVEHSPVGVYLFQDNIIIYSNPKFAEMLGYTRNEISNKFFEQLVYADDLQKVRETISELVNNKQAAGYVQFRGVKKDGTIIDLEEYGSSMIFRHRPARYGTIIDITEHKQAEEALRESEQKYHDIIDNATDLIQSVTPEGNIIYVNQAWMKTLGYSETDIPHLSLKDIIHPDSLSHCIVAFKRLLSEENIGTIEAVFITKDGKKISVEGNVNCRFINGKPAYTRGIFRDITERKQMEDKIAKSLKEKEMLLKEIHHRVKNNMQVISSLLYMQAKTLKDETVKDILRESQNRIKSIALVHEKLYQSTDLDRIDYSDYLRKITDHLFESYQVDPNIIKLQLNLENVFMHINKAVPCSLILNEMISNSLKHAFPKGRTGMITIDVKKKADMYILIYSDDGIGIPEGITFERTESLGMQLIYGLVKQISGSIELERKGGTRYTITFPV